MKPLLCAVAALCLIPASTPAEETPPPTKFSIAHMDPSVDPGTDFYRYANGHWLDSQTIPADQTSWSPTAQLIERNSYQVRELLEACTLPEAQNDPVRKQLGDFYAAALDTERLETLGFKPIAADLARIAALQSKTELWPLIAELQLRGYSAFFDASVSPDERQSSVYALQLTQGGLSLPDRDYYFEKRFSAEREAFKAHVTRMLTLLGQDQAQAAADLKAILRIETALAQASKSLEDLADPVANYHKLSRPALATLAPQIGWQPYFEALQTAKFDSALVGQPDFFKATSQLLKACTLDELKSYLRWQVLTGAAPLLHSAAEQEDFAFFSTTLRGQPHMQPRWKRAVKKVDHSLGEALGQLYVERYFPEKALRQMNEMLGNIQGVYRSRLESVPWMSAPTRQQAVAKFQQFTAKIGAPKSPRDYSKVEVSRDDLLGNVQRATRHENLRDFARIGLTVDRSEWAMTAPTVNAYFNATMNEIVFPAGILQPPFFDPDMDDAVNYGATGATIGHEITHGYDSEGRKFDAQGNLKDWWTKADTKQFDARAVKLVRQFNAYQMLPGLKVNGKLTLGENIADLGGLSIAFEALQRALAADPAKRKLIDGLTPEQRFFISYAQSWAGKYRDAYLRQSLTTDTHAPDMLRGFAPLLNLPEFYQAFSIKPSAPLFRAPAQRAVIW